MTTKAKGFTPSPEMVAAATAVFKCMAWVQTVKPIVNGYQARILADLGFPAYELDKTYLLPDTIFTPYVERCHLERDNAGLQVDNPEACPLLVAEHALILAERAMIDIMEPITKISWDKALCSSNGLENLKELKNITLRLLAPYCKKASGKPSKRRENHA